MRFLKKIFPIFLYTIPIIFFSVCYFLITTSSEDVSQGAGQAVNLLKEIKEAFLYNPRLGELYTWPFINFFNYQYSFGVDTIFRLFDILMAMSLLVVMVVVATGRFPQLNVKDGLLFNVGFLFLVLAPIRYSEVFYARFSFIHNYLIIALLFALLLIPISLEIRKRKLPKTKTFLLASFILGFLFGMSSQVTPVVLIGTVALLFSYTILLSKKLQFNFSYWLRDWKIYTLAGVLFALVVMYGIGSGVASHYANDPLLHYIPLGSILTQPLEALTGLFINLLKNTLILLPYGLVIAACAVLLGFYQKNQSANERCVTKKVILYSSVFSLLYLLAMSQIYFASLLRVTLPIYIVVIIIVLFTINLATPYLKKYIVFVLGLALVAISILTTVDMTKNQIAYNNQIRPILIEIKANKQRVVCVNKEDIKPPVSYFGFHQTPILEEWAMPLNIYDKEVTFCETQ